jgi:geranylgeranyl transferase type-2 subunit alpha
MHGRVRKERSDEEKAKEREVITRKASMYSELVDMITKLRKAGDKSPKALGLTAKLLGMNPDYYTLWNYRREILISMHSGLGLNKDIPNKDAKISKDVGDSVCNEELNLCKAGILRNPKCYGAWWHRAWIFQRFCVDVDSEIELCSDFLDMDQRNFHCWNYRRFVVEQGGVSAESEFTYSTKKIEQNFSNYSAFHHRSVYITQLLYQSAGQKKTAMTAEFAIVENATFTDPYDQSAWWYHRFLLQWMVDTFAGDSDSGQGNENEADELTKQWCVDTVTAQVEGIRSLIECEPECKWPTDSLAHLLEILVSLQPGSNELAKEREGLLQRLIQIDIVRSKRYHYLKEGGNGGR